MRPSARRGEVGAFPAAVFRAVPDASTRVANLVSGASDLVVSLDPDLAMQLEAADGVEPRTALTERVGYLKLNPQKPGLDDPRLRRAIAHAIDRELIVEGLLGGFDRPVGQMRIPPIVGAHSTRSWAPIPFHRGRAFHVIVGGRVGRRRHWFRPGFPGQG